MEIAKHTHAVIVFDADWRHLAAIKRFVGPPDSPTVKPDGSSLLEAPILDSLDDRGLWIELNSGQQKWPDRPVQKMMIPWKFVLGIIIQPGLEHGKGSVGYPQPLNEEPNEPERLTQNLSQP